MTVSPTVERSQTSERAQSLMIYLALGIFFGIILTKSEVISWFRIQEMFRFQGFHMYGIFATAIPTGMISIALIKRFKIKTFGGELITIPPKEMGGGHRYWLGGTFFGLGWALTGACPGPIFALIGNGVTVMAVTLLAALAGTWTYAALRSRLPH